MSTRTIKTTFYGMDKKVELKVNYAIRARSAVLRAVDHMQTNHYSASVAVVYDTETAELHAIIKHNVNGDIKILFQRNPDQPTCVTNP